MSHQLSLLSRKPPSGGRGDSGSIDAALRALETHGAMPIDQHGTFLST